MDNQAAIAKCYLARDVHPERVESNSLSRRIKIASVRGLHLHADFLAVTQQ